MRIARIYQPLILRIRKRAWRKKQKTKCVLGDVGTSKQVYSIISCGKESYGVINVRYFCAPNEKLVVGNYCSIADSTTFILGGGA